MPPADVPRCQVCSWPLAESVEAGCVPGNCSYRPEQGTAEHRRIRARRESIAAGRDPDADESVAVVDELVETALEMIGEHNGRTSLYRHSDGRGIEYEVRRADRPSLLERWAHATIVAFLFGWLLDRGGQEAEIERLRGIIVGARHYIGEDQPAHAYAMLCGNGLADGIADDLRERGS